MEIEENSELNLLDMPEEVFYSVFSKLKERDLYSVCKVCKLFNEIGSDNRLWEGHFLERYRKKEPYLFDVFDEFSKSSKVEYEEDEEQQAKKKKISLINYKKLIYEKLAIERNLKQGKYSSFRLKDPKMQDVEVFQYEVYQGKRYMVTGHQKGPVRVWEIIALMGETKFELLHDIPAHETFIWWLEVKDNICVTAGKEGQVVVIDIITGKVLQRFRNDNRSVWCVDCLPSADIVIGGGDDGEVEVWKISTGERVSQIICDDSIYDINIAANGEEVLVASGVGNVTVWSIADGQKVGELKLPKNDHVIFMRREDDKILLCSTIEGMIYIFDLEKKIVVSTVQAGGSAWSVTLFENYLVAGVLNSRGFSGSTVYVRIWDYKKKTKIIDVVVPTNHWLKRISCTRAMPDKVMCATGGIHLIDFSLTQKVPEEDKPEVDSDLINQEDE